MTKDEVQDFAELIRGYDSWRRHKVQELESSDYHLSASHYLDDIAKQRALDAISELTDLFTADEGFDLTLLQLVNRAREILGIK